MGKGKQSTGEVNSPLSQGWALLWSPLRAELGDGSSLVPHGAHCPQASQAGMNEWMAVPRGCPETPELVGRIWACPLYLLTLRLMLFPLWTCLMRHWEEHPTVRPQRKGWPPSTLEVGAGGLWWPSAPGCAKLRPDSGLRNVVPPEAWDPRAELLSVSTFSPCLHLHLTYLRW